MDEKKLKWNENDVLKFMDETRFQCQLGKHDGLIFVLSCHGTSRNRIILSNGKTFKLSKLFEYFNGDSCRYLIDKPKIFIIDCSRGGAVSQPFVAYQTKTQSQGDSKISKDLYYHSDSNFCFMFGNTEGCQVLEVERTGSHLIRNVHKVLSDRKFTCVKNLNQIIMQIRKETKSTSTIICPQFSHFETTQIVELTSTIEDNIFFKKRME